MATSRPSVMFVNRVYPPVRGATGRVLRDLAQRFAKKGWRVTVITSGPKAITELDGSVEVIRLKGAEKPSGALGYLWIWLKLYITALRQPNPNLLVTLSDPPMIAVAGDMIKRAKGVRHIHWCHDLYPDLFPSLGLSFPGFIQDFLKRRTHRAMEQADKVIVIGRCMARKLAYSGLSTRHITMIPNWPDSELQRDENADDDGSAQAQRRGLAQEAMHNDMSKPFVQQLKGSPKFRVLYAGNIGQVHPMDTVLQAAEVLQESNPEIEFVFVGDGPRFDQLTRVRTERGLDNIKLLPFQPLDKLRQVMESGDVHLVSMKEESAGLLVPSKIYSAFAVGRPCIFIGPRLSEAAKIIRDYKAGAVVHQGDVQRLVKHIKRYRFDEQAWFSAQRGSAEAGKVFVPDDAIDAWVARAWSVVKQDVESDVVPLGEDKSEESETENKAKAA